MKPYGSFRGDRGKFDGETERSIRLEIGRGGTSGSFETPCAAACCLTGRGGIDGGTGADMMAQKMMVQKDLQLVRGASGTCVGSRSGTPVTSGLEKQDCLQLAYRPGGPEQILVGSARQDSQMRRLSSTKEMKIAQAHHIQCSRLEESDWDVETVCVVLG